MNRHGWLSRILLLGTLVALLFATLAAVDAASMASRDPVADRVRLMKLIGASWADLQAKVKAGSIEAAAVNAETIAVSTEHIPALFPKDSLAPNSRAKGEVWQKWEEFVKLARTAETLAVELRDKARAKDQAAVEAAVKTFAPQACGACHTAFRAAR